MWHFSIITATLIVLVVDVYSLDEGSICDQSNETFFCRGIKSSTDIPKAVSKFTTIVYFEGAIDSLSLKIFPDHLFTDPSWRNIFTLTLSDFKFVTKIGNNSFAGFENLKSLSILRFSSLMEINANTFNNIPMLEKLDLSFNHLLSFSEVENAITEKIPHIDHLSLVGLNKASTVPYVLGPKFTAALAKKRLTYLDLSNSNFGGLDKETIMNAFINLRLLNLSYTILAWLPSHLPGNMPNLETLDLSYCIFAPRTFPDNSNHKTHVKNKNHVGHKLSSLKNLYANGLKLSGFFEYQKSVTVEPLWINSSLEYFELRWSDIRVLNITFLGHLGKFNKLDMSNGEFEFISPKFLAYFAPVKTLLLGGNRLGKMEHMTEFREFLSHLQQLESLNLDNNELTYLPKQFLSSNRKIKFLDLHANHLNDLKIDLMHIRNLKYLDLSGNRLRNLPVEITAALDAILDQQTHDFVDTYTNNVTSLMNTRVESYDSDIRRKNNHYDLPNILTVDITGNPLECSCDNLYFVDWISNTQINLVNRSDLTCRFGDAELKLNKEGVSHVQYHCTKLTVIIVCGISVPVTLLIGLTTACCLKRKCYIKKSRSPKLAKDKYGTYEANIKYIRCGWKQDML